MVNQCSNCSAVVKPIVAIDIDGTLSEYHNHLLKHVVNYWGVPGPATEWNGFGDYEDWLGITNSQYGEAKLAFRQGGFKRWSPVMDGLATLRSELAVLREDGEVEVWITTTRPWNRLDSVDPDTRWWLDRNFPVYDHLLYGENKYEMLAQIVDPARVVMVIEDLPDKYEEAYRVFGHNVPALMARPHNSWYRNNYVARILPNLDHAAKELSIRLAKLKEPV